MSDAPLDLNPPEAGLLLNALISLSDDDPSDEEAVVLRKYYRKETAQAAREKLEKGGYAFPGDLIKMEPEILKVLKDSDSRFQRRTLAVGLRLAEADGMVDQREFRLLNHYCAALDTTLAKVSSFAEKQLKELDEVTGYNDYGELDDRPVPADLDLTPAEAGVGITTQVAFADDNPSEDEVAVVKEFFGKTAVESFLKKLTAQGLNFPEDLDLCERAIIRGMNRASREEQTRILAGAYKAARADGMVLPEEREILRRYAQEFLIGEGELKHFL